MIVKLPYRGWNLVAHHQQAADPYLEFVCFASRELSTRKFTGTEVFNVEGCSIRQAVENCCREIDRRMK
jgi:hypothetical protein